MTRRHTWILVGVVAVGALVRFATLDLQGFHHDEAVTAGRVLQPSLWDTLEQVGDSERSPPLYYILAWAWAELFGTDEVGLRSLSALLGTLMVPAAFYAGRELLGARLGLTAAAFVALNPLLVWYSQEARSYILMALLVTLSLAFFARSLNRPSGRSFALWTVACALAISCHYFAIFLVVPQALWLLYADERSSRAVTAALALFATAVALVPLALSQQGEDRRDGFTERSLSERVGEVALDYSASEDPDPLAGSGRVDAVQLVGGVGGALLVLGASALVIGRGSPKERRAWALAGGVAIVGVGLPVVAAAVGVDFLKPRNVMAGVVPVLLATAVGCSLDRARGLGLAGAAALCVLYSGVVVAVNSTAEMQREDWRGVADLIGTSSDTRLIAVPQNGDDPLLYYVGAERFVGPRAKDGETVSEIVAVSTTDSIEGLRGFEVVDMRRIPPQFTVWTLRVDRPTLVEQDEAFGVLSERSTVLVDPPTE